MRGSADQKQAEAVLSEINTLPERVQIALLKALAKEHHTDVADVLTAINALSPMKEMRKEVRRALIQLEDAGIYPEWKPPVPQPLTAPLSTTPLRFWKGMVTDSRNLGEVQLVLCWEQDDDEIRVLSFLLDFWHDGVKDFFTRVFEVVERCMTNFSTHPLVETAWLAEHLSDTDLCIIDARWRGDGSSPELYRAGHIPGAVHLDWHWDLSWTNEAGIRDLLLPPARFAEVMSRVGIGDGKRVVAYAETDHSGAARLWWALHYYGYEQVAVLNGGWDKWIMEKRPVSMEIPRPEGAIFTPHVRSQWIATAVEIERTVQRRDGSTCLIDSRPLEQYLGNAVWTPFGSLYLPDEQHQLLLEDGRFMRGGHIPGARHWHASTTFDPTDWTHLPSGILREHAQKKGIHPEQRIITYCGVGISASQGLFALYLAGYRDLALYDASWEEWGTEGKYPIETNVVK